MENVSKPESIVDLLNGQANLLSASMVNMIKREEDYIANSAFSESSKKGAYYQLTCKVVQELALSHYKSNSKEKLPIPNDFFAQARNMYESFPKNIAPKKQEPAFLSL